MKKVLLLFLFAVAVYGAEKKTVCLNMIVKDESDVIERCLNSVKPMIDYWVIVDTGSTDGTQKLIKECMKGIPGKLYERPWKNFEHNRNEALELARSSGDYLLFIDADEEYIYEEDFHLPALDKGLYYITIRYGGTQYVRPGLIKTDIDWKWVGVLHETLVSKEFASRETLDGVYNLVRSEGARSKDPDTYVKDAKILEEALLKEPNNARYQFYLAQSYRDCGQNEKSIENYQKRVEMGGWDQEVFWSMYQIALLKETQGRPSKEVINAYSDAYVFRPTRAEPLCRLASLLRREGNCFLGYLVAQQGLSLGQPDDALFVEDWMYRYGLELEKSVCAYWIGRYDECLKSSFSLLKQKDLPENIRECLNENLKWATKMLSGNMPEDAIFLSPEESR